MKPFERIAIGLSLSAMTTFSVQAQKSNIDSLNKNSSTKTFLTEKKTVPYKSFQDKAFAVTETLAAATSRDGVVVLYNGTNKEKMKLVLKGANEAFNDPDSIPVKAMLIGPYDPNFKDSSTDSFVIFYSGTKVTKRGEIGGEEMVPVVRDLIIGGYEKVRSAGNN